jgi:hemolysin III
MVMRGRHQSPSEEIANSVSHGVGFMLAVAAVPILVVAAAGRGDAAGIVGGSIFAATMVVLYLTSTLYHAWPRTRVKQTIRALDHGAIFLLIAGTYTPFTLGVLRGGWGWALFGVVWGLAAGGVALKAVGGAKHPRLSVGIYLAMGWLVLIAVKPLWLQVPKWGLFWLLAGGIGYTVGVVFYVAKTIRYSHLVWHLFVLAGSTCHFFAVLWYSA